MSVPPPPRPPLPPLSARAVLYHNRDCKEDISTRNCRTRAALMFILSQPDCVASFTAFCVSQHSEENILCWLAIRDFKTVAEEDTAGRRAAAQAILQQVARLPAMQVKRL